jgi:hypothetical protein
VPGRALHLDPEPPGEVLPEVHDVAAAERGPHAQGGQGRGAPDQWSGRSDQDGGIRRDHVDGSPAGRRTVDVDGRQRPAGPLIACVVVLAVVQGRRPDRAGGRLPPVVGDDDVPGAVGVGQLELGDQVGSVAVDLLDASAEAEPSPVPAVGDHRTEHVLARAHQPGDVVGVVPQAVAIAAPSRGEDVVPHACPVQLGLDQAVCGEVEPGGRDRTPGGEGAPEQRGGARDAADEIVRRAHGVRRPVLGCEEAGLDVDRGAPRAPRPTFRRDPSPGPGRDTCCDARRRGESN